MAGPYFELVNLNRRERMCLGLEIKMVAILSGATAVKAILALSLMACQADALTPLPNQLWGTWAGCRLVIIGEYSERPPPFLTAEEAQELQSRRTTLWALSNNREYGFLDVVSNDWFDGEEYLVGLWRAGAHHVVVNMDKRELLDPVKFGDPARLDEFYFSSRTNRYSIMTAVVACLFYSEGGGSGDVPTFRTGRWAGCRIKIVDAASISIASSEGGKAVGEPQFVDVSDDTKALMESAFDW